MALLPPLPRKYKGTFALVGAGILLLATAAVFGDNGLVRLRELQRALTSLEQRAFQLQQSNEQMREHIRRLESDDALIEKLARERLGLVKPGDLVYRRRPSAHAAAGPVSSGPAAAR
ncbi:septum formation initiator family protein [Candidatus Binatia bacterium]|nr:septum formation initiator family protein [Candidatus Binatia bacterium]